jgi:hypothetical protein
MKTRHSKSAIIEKIVEFITFGDIHISEGGFDGIRNLLMWYLNGDIDLAVSSCSSLIKEMALCNGIIKVVRSKTKNK